MKSIWPVIAVLQFNILGQSIDLRRGVRGTTLTTTANWGLLVGIAWAVTVILSAFVYADSPHIQDQFWYWTAVVSVVPPIAVLGAKRPGSEAWNFFVLLPLVFVLGWPALTVWTSAGPGALRVESPVLIGFVLVLVMGCGNYIATRLAFPALMYALGVVLILAPSSTASAKFGMSTEMFRWYGTGDMVLAVLWSGFLMRNRKYEKYGPDRVWNDFREMFGIVWMKRAMDRINEEFAEREQWPARLGTEGLEWTTAPTPADRSRVEARFTFALHWMLRRFVDPEWIEKRLEKVECPEVATPGLGSPDR